MEKNNEEQVHDVEWAINTIYDTLSIIKQWEMPDLIPGQDKEVEEALDILRKAPKEQRVEEAIEKGEYILDNYPVALHGSLEEAVQKMYDRFVEEGDPTIINFLSEFPQDMSTLEERTRKINEEIKKNQQTD